MNTAGPRRARRHVETDAYLAMTARILTAAGRRVGDADVEDLEALLQLRDLVDGAIVTAIGGLRRSGVTWQDIGDACGTTRQAAIMRYGPLLEQRSA